MRKLFSFKKNEIDQAFKSALVEKKGLGFKLLRAPTNNSFGKLLIIIPRKSGKACKRNVIRRRAQAIFYEEQLFKKPALFILYVSKYGIDCPFDQIKKFLTAGCSSIRQNSSPTIKPTPQLRQADKANEDK